MKHAKVDTSADKLMLGIIGGLTVLIIVVIVAFSIIQNKQTNANIDKTTYSINDKDRPKVSVATKFADLGKMKVQDEKKAEFTIENTGGKPLVLSNISSSCDCTFGTITIDGNTSPEFGMHSKNTWQGTIEPAKKAVLTVVYRPYIMPVSGIVTRDVYLNTNDPENERMTFTISAAVE